MASAAVIGLIVMTLVDYAQLIPESVQKLTKVADTRRLFHLRGQKTDFKYMSEHRLQHNYTAVLLRSTDNGYLCQMNSSDPSQLSRSEQADRVVLHINTRRFILKNLSLSDSGEYVTERWVKGTLREKRLYSLLVCKDECGIKMQHFPQHSKTEVMIKNTNESHGNRLQIYKELFCDKSNNIPQTTLVLDTRLPVEVLPDDLKGIVEMSSNSTTVCISIARKVRVSYMFLIWTGDQCCIKAAYGGVLPCSAPQAKYGKRHFLKPSNRLTLPCPDLTLHVEEITWETPGKVLSTDVSLSVNMSHQEEEEKDMYIQTRNYSLVIPSVEVKHTGRYKCKPDFVEWEYLPDEVFVCSDLEATTVLFSEGGAAGLVCGVELNVTKAMCTFYRHVGPEQEHLTLNPEQMKAIKDESMRKGRMSRSQFSLTMSNLTFNDSGVYYCRMWGVAEEGTLFCFDRKIYLLHKHPFGIHSTFYRVYSALMACALLGMICAVLSVNLKIRGKDQACQDTLRKTPELPGRPIREREPSGGESAYDDAGTAEDTV
ncbi:hypothetical protein ACEWY4_008177 [Coilia grayii]|uniref:Ig-like domain-containing protein n=1 Tax=Coilia grayii TaxID=363190 RepID=A0ABD1KA50_9TELE